MQSELLDVFTDPFRVIVRFDEEESTTVSVVSQLLGDPLVGDEGLVAVFHRDKGDEEGFGGAPRVDVLHALLILFVPAVSGNSGDRPVDELLFPEMGMGIEDAIGWERLQFTLEKLGIDRGCRVSFGLVHDDFLH